MLRDLAEISCRLRILQESPDPGTRAEVHEVRGRLWTDGFRPAVNLGALPPPPIAVAAQASGLQDGPTVGEGVTEQEVSGPFGRDAHTGGLGQLQCAVAGLIGQLAGGLELSVVSVPSPRG